MPPALPQTPRPKKLLTFSSGGWVILLSIFFTLVAAALVLYPMFQTGGFRAAIGDGKNVDTYGFDLSNLTIPKSSLIASGQPKDEIAALPEILAKDAITPDAVKLIASNEHIRFLVPGDEIIGVTINGQSRAYPLRILVLHELANDTLGVADGKAGVPIAVTYSPLSDSAVVFDRRIDGDSAPAPEFGVSGLLVNSTSVFFNRNDDPTKESLWPQLALAAVSGTYASQKMKLIPYTLTTWQTWTSLHPDTLVIEGKRTLKEEYGADPYSTYRSTDALRFPVKPFWSNPNVPKKTRITATSSDAGKSWTAMLPGGAPATRPSADYEISASIFAWYAMHAADTDYSGLLEK